MYSEIFCWLHQEDESALVMLDHPSISPQALVGFFDGRRVTGFPLRPSSGSSLSHYSMHSWSGLIDINIFSCYTFTILTTTI